MHGHPHAVAARGPALTRGARHPASARGNAPSSSNNTVLNATGAPDPLRTTSSRAPRSYGRNALPPSLRRPCTSERPAGARGATRRQSSRARARLLERRKQPTFNAPCSSFSSGARPSTAPPRRRRLRQPANAACEVSCAAQAGHGRTHSRARCQNVKRAQDAADSPNILFDIS